MPVDFWYLFAAAYGVAVAGAFFAGLRSGLDM